MSATYCRCCLALPPDKDLKTQNNNHGEIEVYADMLKECFEIHLLVGVAQGDSGICNECVDQLRSACRFKKQVLKCQKDFDYEVANRVKDEVSNLVKDEVLDSDNDNNEIDFIDLKEELQLFDNEVDEDDKNLALLALEQVAVKRVKGRTKRKVKELGSHAVKKIVKGKTGTSIEKKLKILPILRDTISDTAYISDISKHSSNINNILINSNATPFSNKNLHGYICAYCKETHQNAQNLRKHTKEKHTNDRIDYTKRRDGNNLSVKLDITDLKCSICDKKFDLIKNLKCHLTSAHDINFYDDVNDYVLEFKLNDGGDTLNCALCNSTYETFKMLLQHMNGHYRNFVCEICDMGFINNHRLRNHKRTHETGNFMCNYCEKVFTTRNKRSCHEKYTHKNSARYNTNCPHCEQSFTSYYQRNRHMYQQHNSVAASYKCNVCDRNFLMKSKLTYHIKKVHLMERNHVCAECGQGFFMKQYLEEHMIKHKGERIHKCNVCMKAYARKKTLREHMRIHNNDRRFKCGVCALAFVQKCSLKSHMLSNHGVTLMEFENRMVSEKTKNATEVV